MFLSASHGSSSRASGIRVVFPEPGGADSTAEPAPLSADRSEGTHSSTGSLGSTTGMQNRADRSEEHTSELQSLMRISYAVFCLKKKTKHVKYRTLINNM